MDLKLNIRQSQTLSAQMVQSMKVLQMGSQELMEYISEAIQENPVLETSEPSGGEDDFALLRRKLEWLETTDRREPSYGGREEDDDADPLANYGKVEFQEENLYDHLTAQLRGMELPAEQLAAARGVVESLNGSGYLDEPLDELAVAFGYNMETMEKALTLVQGLDPAGVGARSLSECLCLQLRRMDGSCAELARRIAADCLDALAKCRYPWIARELGAETEQVRKACDLIRRLDPKPGSGFVTREDVRYITPDLYVEITEEGLELRTNDFFFPTLNISSYYKSLLRESDDEQVREYLTAKVRQAKWVVKSVEQRRSTLLDCAACILETQEDFFRRGAGHLVPMSLNDIAQRLGIHESTVSRAVKDKYIQCGHGVYPLSHFFSRGLGNAATEEGGASPDAAKAMLKRLIEEEERKKPLSDQKLCDEMNRQGCPISRRTVAKYRDELGIPPAGGRKIYD